MSSATPCASAFAPLPRPLPAEVDAGHRVVQARQFHQRGLTLRWRRRDALHEVFALSHEGDFAALRQDLRHLHMVVASG